MAKSTVPLAKLPDVDGTFTAGDAPCFGIGGKFVAAHLYTRAEIIALIGENSGGSGTVISVNGANGVVSLTTGEIPEGSRLYYTTARVQADAPNVTIGTANGLSVVGQTLSLATASGVAAGAMSAGDKTKLDGIAAGATANVGTVTSVGLTVPSWLSVSGSPVTTSGTLAVTVASGQTANQVLATPDGATGAVGLRALVAADIPALPESKITNLVSDLAAKAPLASPAFTNTPTAPTAVNATSSTQIATTAFVHNVITDVVGAAPAALDTLKELADAIGDDANFAGTVTTALSAKLVKASNLSDLTNADTALTNLGGTSVGKSIFTAANAGAVRTAAGLVIGTDVQAYVPTAASNRFWDGTKTFRTITTGDLPEISTISFHSGTGGVSTVNCVDGAVVIQLNDTPTVIFGDTGALFLGTLAADNLSGTNTGDQDLSGYAALAGATFSGAVSFNVVSSGNISGGTYTTDATQGNEFRFTAANDTLIAFPTNLVDGQKLLWVVYQGTGGWDITLDAGFMVSTAGAARLAAFSDPDDFVLISGVYDADADVIYTTVTRSQESGGGGGSSSGSAGDGQFADGSGGFTGDSGIARVSAGILYVANEIRLQNPGTYHRMGVGIHPDYPSNYLHIVDANGIALIGDVITAGVTAAGSGVQTVATDYTYSSSGLRGGQFVAKQAGVEIGGLKFLGTSEGGPATVLDCHGDSLTINGSVKFSAGTYPLYESMRMPANNARFYLSDAGDTTWISGQSNYFNVNCYGSSVFNHTGSSLPIAEFVNADTTSELKVWDTASGHPTIEASGGVVSGVVDSGTVSSGTYTTDAAQGNEFRFTAGASTLIAAPSNLTDGQGLTWNITQDATGGRAITLDGGIFVESTADAAERVAFMAAGEMCDICGIYNANTGLIRITAVKRYV